MIAALGRSSNAFSNNTDFPDPFIDVASSAMPQSMRNALYWCEYIYSVMGTYRMAMERVISYFLTDIDISDASEDEKKKYEDFLQNTVDIFTLLQNMLRDRMCYGNSFCSIIIPHKRFLRCPKCASEHPLHVIFDGKEFNFTWSDFKFNATCQKCKFRGAWKVEDRQGDIEKEITVKRWSPHEIEILHDPYTEEVSYIWRIPEDYKSLIRQGHLYHLERAPLQVIEAVKTNTVFRFNKDVVFHMKEPTLAGIRNRGWGIPRIVSNFRQIYYVQVLHRYNEAIALDYVIPFRLITPMVRPTGSQAGGGSTSDSLMTFHGGDFRGQVMKMMNKRRRDPANMQILPFPVQYQMLGGDANQLAPVDLINQGVEQLLNDAGTPVELYNGSLQLQTAPVALRLFESTWHHLVHDTNMLLRWLVKQLSQIMNWEVVDAKLKRVTIADDMNKQMAALQLMMGQQLSGTSGLRAIGFDWGQEQKLMAEEAKMQAELQARNQEELDQAGMAQQLAKGQAAGGGPGAQGGQAQGGQPQGGGQPQPGGDPSQMGAMGAPLPVDTYLQSMPDSVPQTPKDMLSAADQLASGLLGLPESVKDSQLRKLKQGNEVLHSLVRSRMDSQRNDQKNQASASQQMGQGG